jgi:membrane protein
MGYAKHIPVFGIGTLKILPVMLTTLAFAMLFQLVPNRYVPRAHAWIGAIVASVVFESMNRVFGYFISHFASYKLVYGAFASVPIFLLWIYLSWLTILVGAVISASLSYWRSPANQNMTPTAQLLDALRVLRMMMSGLERGQMSTLPQLSKSLTLGYDALEDILEKLASANIVRRAEGHGWLLMRDASHIRGAELLDLFVLKNSVSLADKNDDSLQQWLTACTNQLERNTDITLQELFARSSASRSGA